MKIEWVAITDCSDRDHFIAEMTAVGDTSIDTNNKVYINMSHFKAVVQHEMQTIKQDICITLNMSMSSQTGSKYYRHGGGRGYAREMAGMDGRWVSSEKAPSKENRQSKT